MDARETLDVLAADEALSYLCVDASGNTCADQAFIDALGNEPFTQLTFDSREVVPGALFICKGAAFDPAYLIAAQKAGARAYVSECVYADSALPGIIVNRVRRAMARLAVAFYDDPSEKLRVIGITGTKGKTTVSYYVDAILRARETAPSGILSSVVVDDGQQRYPSPHVTTPEPIELQQHLAHAVDAGCDAMVVEVSSHGLKYERTLGTHFSVGVFINIGEDHVSPIEHPSFEDYFASKLLLFDDCDHAVVNHNTDLFDEVYAAAQKAQDVMTYSTDPACDADVVMLACERTDVGKRTVRVRTPQGEFSFEFDSLGGFNVSNALAAICVGLLFDVSLETMGTALANISIPGRMERYDVPGGAIIGIIDFAHNELSIGAALQALREEFPGYKLTLVVGANGDKALNRREGIGRAAARYADFTIITEDDASYVPVRTIADEIAAPMIEAGADFIIVEDREEAVRTAVESAHEPTVILIAGKGTEDTMYKAEGTVKCKTDAQLFCEAAGIEFKGYDEAFMVSAPL